MMKRILVNWLRRGSWIAVLMDGMVGSSNGARETSYVQCATKMSGELFKCPLQFIDPSQAVASGLAAISCTELESVSC